MPISKTDSGGQWRSSIFFRRFQDRGRGFFQIVLGCFSICVFPAHAIDIQPSPEQIQKALHQGFEAARDRLPPDRLYFRVGSEEEFSPRGFLMTKMNGLTVMASHFGLRGEKPTQADIDRILEETELLVSVKLFGDSPSFAMDSYLVLKQGDHIIKPVRVRFDAVAHRTARWPHDPRYHAKVIAYFRYQDLQLTVPTTILVFPARGGEIRFDVDLSAVP